MLRRAVQLRWKSEEEEEANLLASVIFNRGRDRRGSKQQEKDELSSVPAQ